MSINGCFFLKWTSWPFNWISDELINLLFNPSWENRHGACLALRNIMKKHGKGSGRHRNMDKQQVYIEESNALTCTNTFVNSSSLFNNVIVVQLVFKQALIYHLNVCYVSPMTISISCSVD